ncbi:MAG: hypothetical protein M3P42_02355, partial [Actinomycetota bacterium]|nr:hypothetical protein [Actinomycetota bacterium]
MLVAVAFGLAAGTFMGQLQAILARMHPPGGPAADVGSLWGIVPNADGAREIVDAWTAYADGPGFHSAELVLRWFVRADVVFALAYGLLVWSLLAWVLAALRLKIDQLGNQERPDKRQLALLLAYTRLAWWAQILVVALVLSDFAEGWLTLELAEAARDDAGTYSLFYWLFWGVSLLKWSLALLVVASLLVSLWSLPATHRQEAKAVGRALNLARPQLLVVLA